MSLLASLRGRIQHYSSCLPHILPFTALLSSILGTEGDADYDTVIPLPPIVGETALFVRGVLEDYAVVGRPLWPFIPSTLYASFLAGETGNSHVAVISWDASPLGWGAVVRWWDNRDGKVIVGSLPDSPDMAFQVRRETLGGVLALEAASRSVDLSEAVVILRNDAIGALSALRKGSFSSTFLQQCAMRACRLERAIGCHTLHLHAPGQTLIDEGIDDLSRDKAADIAGPVSGPGLRERVLSLAASLGWTLTIDAFATAANTLLPRFFARYAEPDAEAEDAFSVGDWDCSLCPSCGSHHREVLFAYPHPSVLNRFVAKARADGARAIVVTPLSVSAPYWSKLLRASVVPGEEGFLRLTMQQSAPAESDRADNLAIFAVDFASSASRRRTLVTAPSCGADSHFRGRPLLGSSMDQADRARIHQQLAALHVTLRDPVAPPT
jgi:hypothetical protein